VAMEVKLRNPDRTIDVTGAGTVSALVTRLKIIRESVLVIRNSTLLTRDEWLSDDVDDSRRRRR
jgi:sulfur carrier protein ThiS